MYICPHGAEPCCSRSAAGDTPRASTGSRSNSNGRKSWWRCASRGGRAFDVEVTPLEAYELWAPTYDASPNPLTALESRILKPQIGPVDGLRFFDLATGTGRWMKWAQAHGADVFGI